MNDSKTRAAADVSGYMRPDDGEPGISPSDFLRVLEGVGVATKTSTDVKELIARWTSSNPVFGNGGSGNNLTGAVPPVSLDKWSATIKHELQDEKSCEIAKLALGVALL